MSLPNFAQYKFTDSTVPSAPTFGEFLARTALKIHENNYYKIHVAAAYVEVLRELHPTLFGLLQESKFFTQGDISKLPMMLSHIYEMWDKVEEKTE